MFHGMHGSARLCGPGSREMERSGQKNHACSVIRTLLLVLVIALFGMIGAPVLPAAGASEITYPVNMFENGKARHFQYKTTDGATIKYFVMKSSDGVIRAAFDACDVCWREGKGYTQKDDFMVCNNCGRRFPSARINEVSGGCNPAPLARKVEAGKVIIKVENILQGRQYFAFRGGRQ